MTNWWGIAATLFAASSLLAVVWQIIRFEATQPSFGWSIRRSKSGVVVNGWQETRVTFKPVGPIVIHEVEIVQWDDVAVSGTVDVARMDCDSEPLEANVRYKTGTDGYVGFTWLEPSLIRRNPVRHTMRVKVSDLSIELWKWYWIPRPSARRQGKWYVWKMEQKRRTHVPDMWDMPGSK